MVGRFRFLGVDNGVDDVGNDDDEGTEEDKAAARLDDSPSIYHK